MLYRSESQRHVGVFLLLDAVLLGVAGEHEGQAIHAAEEKTSGGFFFFVNIQDGRLPLHKNSDIVIGNGI